MRAIPAVVLAMMMAMGGAAYAADPIVVPVTGAQGVVPVAEGSFDWSGFYAGVFGVAQRDGDGNTGGGIGIAIGVNAQFDFVLVGAEVALEGLTGDTLETSYGQVVGRTGVLLTDDVMLYAAAGYGADLGAVGQGDLLAGGGLEVAVSDAVSLQAQYLHGFALEDDSSRDQLTLGANIHF